jgi:hypothetical protein
MLIFFLPNAIREVYFIFKDIFNTEGYGYLNACCLLLFFLTGSNFLSDFVRLCPFSPSVSTLSRLAASFKPNRFMRRNQSRVLKKLNERGHGDFCFAVDDTANPKFGSVFGSAAFHSSAGSYFGQKIMVLVIVDLKTHQALPIDYIFLTSKKDPNHIPGPQRAVDLIKGAIASGFPPLPVTSDSWFGSKEFIKSVRQLGCEFAGEIKSNRITRTNIAPGSEKKKIGVWFEKLERIRIKQTRFQKRREKKERFLVN